MNRSIVRRVREQGDRIVLALGALTAYALAFIPPYSTTDIGLVVLAAAPVLAASWLFVLGLTGWSFSKILKKG